MSYALSWSKLSLEHVKKYDIKAMCNQYLKVYEGLLGREAGMKENKL